MGSLAKYRLNIHFHYDNFSKLPLSRTQWMIIGFEFFSTGERQLTIFGDSLLNPAEVIYGSGGILGKYIGKKRKRYESLKMDLQNLAEIVDVTEIVENSENWLGWDYIGFITCETQIFREWILTVLRSLHTTTRPSLASIDYYLSKLI